MTNESILLVKQLSPISKEELYKKALNIEKENILVELLINDTILYIEKLSNESYKDILKIKDDAFYFYKNK